MYYRPEVDFEERAFHWFIRALVLLVIMVTLTGLAHVAVSCNQDLSGQTHKIALTSVDNWKQETGKEGVVSCDRTVSTGGTVKCTLVTLQKEVVPLECSASAYMSHLNQSCHLGQKAILDNR